MRNIAQAPCTCIALGQTGEPNTSDCSAASSSGVWRVREWSACRESGRGSMEVRWHWGIRVGNNSYTDEQLSMWEDGKVVRNRAIREANQEVTLGWCEQTSEHLARPGRDDDIYRPRSSWPRRASHCASTSGNRRISSAASAYEDYAEHHRKVRGDGGLPEEQSAEGRGSRLRNCGALRPVPLHDGGLEMVQHFAGRFNKQMKEGCASCPSTLRRRTRTKHRTSTSRREASCCS